MRLLILVLLSALLARTAPSQGCSGLPEIVGFGSTLFSTASGVPGTPCFLGSNFVGFRWTAPWDGTFYVADCGSNSDTVLGMRFPCGPGGTSISCGDDNCNTSNEWGSLIATGGATYEFDVGTFWPTDEVTAGRLTVLPFPMAGISFCWGTDAACPCANSGQFGRGCRNSIEPRGGLLCAGGSPSAFADSLVLVASGIPNGTMLLLQGDASVAGGAGSAFGDGLRCAGGHVVRLSISAVAGTVARDPQPGGTPISIRGAVGPGDVRYYQAWYRDAAAYCTVATFNLTNGVQVTWGA